MARDAVEPCPERGWMLERAELAHDGEPHLLAHIFRVGGAPDDPAQEEQEARVVPLDEPGVRVAGTELRTQHEQLLEGVVTRHSARGPTGSNDTGGRFTRAGNRTCSPRRNDASNERIGLQCSSRFESAPCPPSITSTS